MASNADLVYSPGDVAPIVSTGKSSNDKGSEETTRGNRGQGSNVALEPLSSGTSGAGQPAGLTAESQGKESVNDTSQETTPENSHSGDEGISHALQFPNRVMRLTVAQCAVGAIQAAKGNAVAGAAVSAVETLVALAAVPTAFVCGPAAAVCEAPVRGADWLLCKGLDATEALVPCMFMPPAQVYGGVQSCAGACVCCIPRTVAGVASRICSSTADKLN